MKTFLLNALLFSVFITNNNNLALIFVTILFFSVCFLYGTAKIDLIKFLIIASIILPVSLNLFHLEVKTILRVIQLFVGFMFFPLNIKRDELRLSVLRVAIAYVFFFFVGNAFNIVSVQDLILKLYPTEGNSWIMLYDGTDTSLSTSINEVVKQRLASIYYNPNILGQNMAICFAIFLLYYYDKKIKLLDYLTLVLIITMILGSGGRTAFIAFVITLFFFAKKFTSGRAFYGVVIPIFAYALYFIAFNTRLLMIFFVTENHNDSMGIKNQLLMDYFKDFRVEDFFRYLFGHLTFDRQFDYDVGDILYNFGILGLASIALFMLNQFMKCNARVRYFYAFLLLSYGATLIINYKFFILTVIVLSMIRELSASLAPVPVRVKFAKLVTE